MFNISLLLFYISLFGCAQHSATMERSSPAVKFTAKKQGNIDIADIRLDPSIMNKQIGNFHESFIHPITYYGSHANFPKSIYLPVLSEELRNAHYPILASGASVFEKELRGENKADLLIGGMITHLKFDSYSEIPRGRMSEATVMIKWELFDNTIKKVIYNKMTLGSATGPMSLAAAEPVTIAASVRSSFKKLLSDSNFVNAVEKGFQKE